MKNTNYIFIIAGIILLLLIVPRLGLFAVTSGDISRNLPTQVETGKTFTVTYTSTATGTWGASIQESLSGGCKFPDGTSSYKTVMLSADGATKSVLITTPSTASTCTLTGDYKFGNQAVKAFASQSVNVKTCKTEADTNCDNKVDRTELGVAINQWIANIITRDKLGEAIQAWIEG